MFGFFFPIGKKRLLEISLVRVQAPKNHSPSVHDLRVTIVTLQLGEDVVGVPAAEVAEARLDPQHLPGEGRPVGALELHVDGFGLVGDAAALVRAHAAVFRPVELRGGAA